MAKKILGLGPNGKLVLKLPSGEVQPLPKPTQAWAFLLIDCSSSMAGTKIAQAKDGALTFAEDALKKDYLVGLIGFATVAETLCLPEEGFSTLASRIESLEASGSTNMADGIKRATQELNKHSGFRAIVVVTDGIPDNQHLALDAARLAKEASIDIIAIGTDDADRNFLGKVASRSELAMKVSRAELKSGITTAARLLPKPTATG